MFGVLAERIQSPWRFQLHLEVWLLVATVVIGYTYAIRVVGPKAVPDGEQIVSRRNLAAFGLAVFFLWAGSDWPVHDIAEEYLYSVHMVQHMVLSYFVPPLALLATPTWLYRLIFGHGRTARAMSFLSRAVIAGVIFNLIVMISHIPDVVNRSVSNGFLHYAIHVLLVSTALLMWMPICGPEPKFRISPMGKMIYLFLISVVPTIPAAWLTFADQPVYKHYDIPVRVWGVSVISDQQAAGGIMKLGGAVFLWTIIITIYIRNFSIGFSKQQSYRRKDETLTFEEVTEKFKQSEPPVSPI